MGIYSMATTITFSKYVGKTPRTLKNNYFPRRHSRPECLPRGRIETWKRLSQSRKHVRRLRRFIFLCDYSRSLFFLCVCVFFIQNVYCLALKFLSLRSSNGDCVLESWIWLLVMPSIRQRN